MSPAEMVKPCGANCGTRFRFNLSVAHCYGAVCAVGVNRNTISCANYAAADRNVACAANRYQIARCWGYVAHIDSENGVRCTRVCYRAAADRNGAVCAGDVYCFACATFLISINQCVAF